MSDYDDKKILRSFYLPEALDERLRVVAFRLHQSKGEVVRQLLGEALEARASSEPDTYVVSNLFGRVSTPAPPRSAPAANRTRFAGGSDEIAKPAPPTSQFWREAQNPAHVPLRPWAETTAGLLKPTRLADLGVDHAEIHTATNIAPVGARVTFSYGEEHGEAAEKSAEIPSTAHEG